jgi:hypothetical protein
MNNEFIGGLIQKDTTFVETGISELSHLPATKPYKRFGIEGSRWLSWLKKVSIGQYRTPLYYKKSDSWSSIIGGVVTLIGIVLIITFAFVTLIPIL